MKPLILGLAVALAIAPVATSALAQSAGAAAKFDATTLDLSGHGEAKVPPDMAAITFGVSTQDPTAAGAMRANAAAMTKVIAALRAGGIDASDIRTSALNLNAQYVYPQGAPQRLTGYQATNQVTVTVEDLGRLGPAVDAVTTAGATDIGQISFGLKVPGSALNYARLAAVKDLDDKAASFADAAGYHIRRLVNLKEVTSQQGPAPRIMMAMATPAGPATPIESGQITVSVDVTGEFELTH